MERLNHQVLLGLSEKFDVHLCGPKGCKSFVPDIPCTEFIAAPAWRYAIESMTSALLASMRFKPNVVYAGSGLAAPAATVVGKLANAPVVTYLHGLDIIAPDLIYQNAFLPFAKRSARIIVNSRNTALLANQSGFDTKRIHVIHPGTHLPSLDQRQSVLNDFRKRLNLGDRPILLSAGRLTPRKGLVEFVEHALPGLVARIPDLCLLIIGDEPRENLSGRSSDLMKNLTTAIEKQALQKSVLMCGNVSDANLSAAFFAADLFVFPVLDLPGDVEGFGMVAIEAAAHGLPTVGFAVGGIPDAVEQGVSGYLAKAGDYRQLSQLIVQAFGNARPSFDSCRSHAEKFSWPHFHRQIAQLMIEVTRK